MMSGPMLQALLEDRFKLKVHWETRDSGHLLWIPDGDEAFDDGSHVLQFDLNDRVRLVGFKRQEEELYDRNSLVDLWLPSDAFYGTLTSWNSAFDREWRMSLQVSN